VVNALLDSGATGLVMSEEFTRKYKFRRTKLERPIYVRNVDGTLNYVGLIVDTVEVEIYFKGHKERMSIDIIEGQKWSVILGMPWLACHNSEIDWKTREVQMIRCLDECGKKWRIGKQTKPGWKKQHKKEEKKEIRKLMTDEEIEEMVPRQFHKYLKVFEKKESERMPMKKAWDHVIDLREGFVPKRGRYTHCQE